MPGFRGVRPIPLARLALTVWASSQTGCFLLGYEGLGKTADGGSGFGDGGDGSAQLTRDGAVGDDAGSVDSGLTNPSHPDSGLGGSTGDAGADGGSDAPSSGWWDGITPITKCSGLIGSAACNQTCTAAENHCVYHCDAASCGSSCAAFSICRSTCSGLSCGHTCASKAECSYEADATQNTAICATGSICDVTCKSGGTCSLTCAAGASCLFRCKALTCNDECTGVRLECDDGSVVCDRPCPK